MADDRMKDYVEVADRIREWYAKHPNARIVPELVENADARVTMKAAVYRTDDPLEPPAGVGHSALAIPGKTPFTRDSELENAETSAVGRALVMAGIPSKHVASAGEVRSKTSQATPGNTPPPARPAPAKAPPPRGGGTSRSGGSKATAAGQSREDAAGSKTPAPARATSENNPWEGMEGFQ